MNFPRSDSVRSNISAYPILNGGGSKVVRLIREDSTPQTAQSALRGGLVRKIQTPLSFKGKLKVTKKSSALKGPKAPPSTSSATSSLLKQLVDDEEYFSNGK
jgi:hypothetical protein